MIIYLKGYYGYKNLGDELLLFGVLDWLSKQYNTTKIYIEAGHVSWLRTWIKRNDRALPEGVDISIVSKKAHFYTKRDLTVFGGGEVVTDERPFPYNGWTYILGFFWTILRKKHIVIGGVGTIKKPFTGLLYKFFLGRAQTVILREKNSFKRVKDFTSQAVLYHDFCYDFLKIYAEKYGMSLSKKQNQLLVNINKYIWNDSSREKIISAAKGTTKQFYLAGEKGTDSVFYDQLKTVLPNLEYVDRTTLSLQDLFALVQSSSYGVAARLHVLLLLDYFGVPYTPLVYQEKINHVLGIKK